MPTSFTFTLPAACVNITAGELATRARERADMVGSSFVSDARLYEFLTEAHQKLHGMLVDALGEEYSFELASFTTVGGQAEVAVPCSFFKLYGVDLDIGGRIRSLKPFNRAQRNVYRNATSSGVVPPMYLLSGGNVTLYPEPPDGLEGQILYAPGATLLTLPTDLVAYPNGWERFIVIDAAIQMLVKEESSVTALSAERDRIIKEIEQTKETRDLAAPKQVVDVYTAALEDTLEPWW